jgi:hypothetical protein
MYAIMLYNIIAMEKQNRLDIRLTDSEKQAFMQSAELAGIPLSSWIRERLRLAAIRELENAGQKIPFVQPIHIESEKNDND